MGFGLILEKEGRGKGWPPGRDMSMVFERLRPGSPWTQTSPETTGTNAAVEPLVNLKREDRGQQSKVKRCSRVQMSWYGDKGSTILARRGHTGGRWEVRGLCPWAATCIERLRYARHGSLFVGGDKGVLGYWDMVCSSDVYLAVRLR